jgi:hypothetical protein
MSIVVASAGRSGTAGATARQTPGGGSASREKVGQLAVKGWVSLTRNGGSAWREKRR